MQKSDDGKPLLEDHSEDDEEVQEEHEDDISNAEEPGQVDERFDPPSPSPWKRLALILLVILLFYFGFHLRAALLADKKPQVIYANRYSKEHKFRPAASPIITETLKDGRVRIRGAQPSPTATVTSSPVAKKRRRPSQAGRASGKAKRRKSPAVAKQ